MKHTQGKWKLHDMEANVVIGVDHLSIADANARNRIKEENQANVKFIVKACNSYYNLLEACKEAYKALHGNPNIPAMLVVKLKQAISKTEGE